MNSQVQIEEDRKPRGIITINGQAIHWMNFEVDNNNYYLADTFHVDLPLNDQPKGFDFNYWATTPSMLIEVFAGFPTDPNNFTKDELDSLILGQVDDVNVDPVNGIVTLSGRDLTARFIDNKTTEKFQNHTSSQIAILLAQRRNLIPIVTLTTTKVGRYYEIDHARLTSEHSEWDLLTYLAQEENFAVFVKGKNLYFQPRPKGTDAPYILQWQSPIMMHHSP